MLSYTPPPFLCIPAIRFPSTWEAATLSWILSFLKFYHNYIAISIYFNVFFPYLNSLPSLNTVIISRVRLIPSGSSGT